MKRLHHLYLLCCGLLLLSATSVIGQTRYFDQWHFADHVGLDFRSGSPVRVPSSLYTSEGSASICDPITGGLLFYTDGITVWNREHDVMVGGTGLYGHESSTQSALIVPAPGNPNLFYLFTVSYRGVYYSLVDMREEEGRGSVVDKNVVLLEPSNEKVTAVRACNKNDFWIIAHKYATNHFYAWRLTDAGLDDEPVVSEVGTEHVSIGALKASPDGRLLVSLTSRQSELLHFDNSTGAVGPVITTLGASYSASFSPNSRFLYTSSPLTQYDVSLEDSVAIESSTLGLSRATTKGMQIGPDGKVYFLLNDLYVIDHPDEKNPTYRLQGLNLDLWAFYGLPNCIDGFLGDRPDGSSSRIITPDTTICYGDSILLAAYGGNRFKWESIPSGGCDTCARVMVAPTETTTYIVSVTQRNSCADIAIDSVTIAVNKLDVRLTSDTAVCAGESVQLLAEGGKAYRWSPAEGLSCVDCPNPVAGPTGSTTYVVEVIGEQECSVVDSVRVVVHKEEDRSVVASDTVVCVGEMVELVATGGTEYQWSPVEGLSCADCPNPVVRPERTTTWVVRSTLDGKCPMYDTITVAVHEQIAVTASPDTIICVGDSVQVFAASDGEAYQWTPAEGLSCVDCPNPVVRPMTTTMYFVEVRNQYGCVAQDSVLVTVRSGKSIDARGDTVLCKEGQSQLLVEGAEQYQWSPSVGLSCDDCANPIASPRATTTYYVVGTNNSGGCASIDSVKIVVHDNPVAEAGDNVLLCAGQSVQLQGSGGERYQWSASPNLSCLDCPDPFVSPTSTATYYLTVANAAGCESRDSVTVVVLPDWHVQVGKGATLCLGDSVALRSEGGVRWEWEPAEGLSCTDCAHPVASPVQTTEYRLTAWNAEGCESRDSVEVVVRDESAEILVQMGRDHSGGLGEPIRVPVELPISIASTDVDAIEFVLEYDPRVLLLEPGSIADWFVGGLLEGWNVQVREARAGRLVLDIQAHSGESLAGVGMLFMLQGKMYLSSVEGTELTFSIRSESNCYRFRTEPGYVRLDSVCGLHFRLIEFTSNKYIAPTVWPNPAHERVTLEFGIGLPGHVHFEVYDRTGNVVGVLLSAELSSGIYSVEWDVQSLPAGTYWYCIKSGDWTKTGRVLVLK